MTSPKPSPDPPDPIPTASPRDFIVYGRQRPPVRWPGSARVALSFVVNFEEGAEFSIADGEDRNEAIYEVIDRQTVPDRCIDSHFEYGTRVASWRFRSEEGAEFSMADGDDRNEAIYEVIDRQTVPDRCIDSHFEYGTRVAYWRI